MSSGNVCTKAVYNQGQPTLMSCHVGQTMCGIAKTIHYFPKRLIYLFSMFFPSQLGKGTIKNPSSFYY